MAAKDGRNYRPPCNHHPETCTCRDWEPLRENKESINYVHTEPDSQFYTDLSQLLQTMKILRMNKDILAARKAGRIINPMTHEQEIDYIIKGLENTIERGYKINEPVPEGYQRIDVKEGSYVTPPDVIPEKVEQKQAIIDIMRADEEDGLYDTPKCFKCSTELTLVRPGKWQCDHCGF